MEVERISSLKPLLRELGNENLPFLHLQYKDSEGMEHSIPAVYLGDVDSLAGSHVKNMVEGDNTFKLETEEAEPSTNTSESLASFEPSYHVAFGSDNSWYLFTEKWIKSVYRTGFPNVALNEGDPLPRELISMLLDKEGMQWAGLVESELGGLWQMEGSLETWSWSLNVPMLSSLSEDAKVSLISPAYVEAVECYKKLRNKVAHLKKRISRTEGFREYKRFLEMAKLTEGKIRRLKNREKHLTDRIEQIEPSGWKEFL